MATNSSGSHLPSPFVRSPYNYDREAVSLSTGIDASHDGRTKQEFTQECDPNYIVDRHLAGADLVLHNALSARSPMEGDFTGFPESYHAALNFVRHTERSFLTLDAKIRAKFDNDPQNFLNFLADDANYDDAVKLGLLDLGLVKARRDAEGLSPDDGGSSKDPKPSSGGKAPDDSSKSSRGGRKGD